MLLRNARICTERGVQEGSILIEDGRIAEVGRHLKAEGESINLRHLLVLPGMVDIHVHLRDFTQSRKEDITSGTSAALAGGVTTCIEMPNTSPPIDSRRALRRRLHLASRRAVCDFWAYLGVTKENCSGGELEGAIAKAYLDGSLGELGYGELEQACRSTRLCAVHAEDAGVIAEEGRSRRAELVAVEKVGEIAEHARVHICHISLPESIEKLGRATCEVTPHHLLLTEKHGVRVNPPLRSQRDCAALWRALADRRIHCIASDHAPHESRELPGIPGLETTLPLMLTMVRRGRLSMERLVEAYSSKPAKLLGLESKGGIERGKHADLVVVDPRAEWVIRADRMHTRAGHTPFEGWRVRGMVKMTFLRGELVFQDGEVLASPGYGTPVLRL